MNLLNRILLAAVFIILSSSFETKAQVTVTYVVDISLYLDSGNVLDTAGIRIGGRFSPLGINNIPDWTPSAPPCKMNPIGFNRWSITIQYPDSAKGKAQDFKFVNGNWGNGRDERSVLLAGCGYISGGIVNRRIIIPNTNTTFSYCWNSCSLCPVQFSVVTGAASSITSNSASISGYVTGTGIIQQGIVYGTNANPTVQNSFAIDAGDGTGAFSANISQLSPNTTYYFRSFARRNSGVTYGNISSFSTLPIIQLIPVTFQVDMNTYLAYGYSIGPQGMRISGNFMKRGVRRGAFTVPDWIPSDSTCAMEHLSNNIWSITLEYPDSSFGKIQQFRFVNSGNEAQEGPDSLLAGGCAEITDGFVRRNFTIPFISGTFPFCWEKCSPVCSAPVPPVLIGSAPPSQISYFSARVSSSAIGINITRRGFCYSTEAAPDTSDFLAEAGSGSGVYEALLTGLNPGTSYYARAFAQNAVGISYGSEIIFNTSNAFSRTFVADISLMPDSFNVGPNGLRIAGNFAELGAQLPDWDPNSASAAMADSGNGTWWISILYPDTAVGKVQKFLFFNSDSSGAESTDAMESGGCALPQGAGFARSLTLSNESTPARYCWNSCAACPVAVQKQNDQPDWYCFPNPADGILKFAAKKTQDIQIINSLGQQVRTFNIQEGNTLIQLKNLPSGIYRMKDFSGKTRQIILK